MCQPSDLPFLKTALCFSQEWKLVMSHPPPTYANIFKCQRLIHHNFMSSSQEEKKTNGGVEVVTNSRTANWLWNHRHHSMCWHDFHCHHCQVHCWLSPDPDGLHCAGPHTHDAFQALESALSLLISINHAIGTAIAVNLGFTSTSSHTAVT